MRIAGLEHRSWDSIRATRMTSAAATADSDKRPGLLARERIIAKPGFNRWLVPPCALAIHLCIGMAYGFSSRLSACVGVSSPSSGPASAICVQPPA